MDESEAQKASLVEEELLERAQYLAVTLRSIGDALIATDAQGCVSLMNPVAERLTGYSLAESAGVPLEDIFHIINEETRLPVETPVKRVLREGNIVGLANHTVLISKDGTEWPIADSAAPILTPQGKLRGVVLVFRDQTEERKAERALRESEERLHLLIEGVTDYALYMLDPRGYIVSWNSGAERIKGYRAAEIVGQHFSRLFVPEDLTAGKPQRILDTAIRQGRFGEEAWRMRKDGSRFWANCVLTALHDSQGQLRGFAKITRDLTAQRADEQRQRELIREQAARTEAEAQAQQLQASEERYREAHEKLSAVLSGLEDGITMQDAAGRLVYANDVAARSLGYPNALMMLNAPAAEIAAKYSLLDENGMPLSLDFLPGRRVLAGEPAQERLVGFRLHATGEERWTVVRANPVRDEESRVQFVINFFRDITDKRREELRRNFIAQAMSELSSSLDYQATLATVARLAVPQIADWCAVDVLESEGLKRLAVEHINPAKIAWVHEIERRYPPDPHAKNGVPNILRTGKPEMLADIPQAMLEAAAVDAEHLRLIRELQLRSYIGVPLHARGKLVGVITFVMAESNRRYNQEDLALALQLADRAAVAIDNARLFREAQQARADAELANRGKDEFLAILGHELRNPLAPIMTALHLIKLRAGNSFERERTIIERQIKHMVRLVEDLLDISRITRGKVELRKEPLVLAEVIAQAIEMSSPLLEERHHDVTVDVPRELRILGDEIRLAQVVANLLNNAAKYTEKAGRISIIAERIGHDISLRIRDNGMGIAPEMLPRIFDMFAQEHQALDRSQGGLGIGLALVRSLVHLHGGSVSAHSAGLGQGTEVRILLPALDAAQHAVPAVFRSRLSPTPRSPGAAQILIVDDNVDAGQLLAEALETQGYGTHLAYDGPSALVLAEKVRPQIALLDIGLPVMDGYEVARRIRGISGLSHICLVALTGYGQYSDRQLSKHAGFDEHLVKPIDLQALLTTLERLLGSKRDLDKK